MTLIYVNSALHPSWVAKSSTSLGSDKAGKSQLPGGRLAQVILCDPIWLVISRTGQVIFTNCYIRFAFLAFTHTKKKKITGLGLLVEFACMNEYLARNENNNYEFYRCCLMQLKKSNSDQVDDEAGPRPMSVHYHHYGPVPDNIGHHHHQQQQQPDTAQVYTLPPIQV